MRDTEMADNKKQEEHEGAEKAAPKQKKKSMPLIILGVVIALAALGAGGYFLYSGMNPAMATDEEGNPIEPQEITETNIFFSGFSTGIVNLAVSSEYPFMYLKYNFELEVDSNAVISEIVSKLPKLTSKVAGVISNRNWNEISSAQGRERLSRDCLRAINDELISGKCIGLYFTTFIAQ